MKRLWSMLIVLLLMPCLVMVAAAETSGTCGENLTWEYDSGEKTLTISGTGRMYDYTSIDELPWGGDIRRSFRTLVIEEGVTGIGDKAFYQCGAVETLTLPQSLTEIGAYTFYDCSSLFRVEIPAGVTRIGEYAFAEDDLLSFIYLPESLEKIPEGLFKNCNLLNTIRIPASVTEIGEDAFLNCYDLQAYTVAQENTVYSSQDGVLFSKDGTKLLLFPSCFPQESYEIPAKVTKIAPGAFRECATLREVKLSAGITELESGTFVNMDYLYLHLSSGLRKVQENAVTNVKYVFCVYVQDIMDWINIFEGDLDYDPFAGAKTTIYLYVNGSWYRDLVLPSALTKIPAWTFAYCDINAVIPDTVREIGHHAFYESSIGNAVVPDSVTKIGEYAFANCFDMYKVKLSDNLKVIPAYCFYNRLNRYGLESVVLPQKLEKIEDGAFYGCGALEKIYMPSTVKTIGSKVFYKCSKLADLYYGGTKTQRKAIDSSSSSQAQWHYEYVQKPEIEVVCGDTQKPIVRWESCNFATSYRVYRKTGSDGKYTLLAKTTGLKYRDTSAKAGKTYYYKVKSVNADAGTTSAYSNVVKKFCILPEVSVKRSADAATGKPKLSWQKIAGAEEYQVRRDDGSNRFAESFTTTDTTFIDKTAEAGTRYWYKVYAIHSNEDANSQTAAIISAICDLPRPVVKIYLKDGAPRIRWAAIEEAEKYMVYRATSKDGEYTHVKTTKTATSYTDQNAEAGKTYYYKVKAIHKWDLANSAFSAVKYIEAQ